MSETTEEQVERARLLVREAEETYISIRDSAIYRNEKARALQEKAAERLIRRRDAWLALLEKWLNWK
jgi:hypothetical protein